MSLIKKKEKQLFFPLHAYTSKVLRKRRPYHEQTKEITTTILYQITDFTSQVIGMTRNTLYPLSRINQVTDYRIFMVDISQFAIR